jgi:hypothetical protein
MCDSEVWVALRFFLIRVLAVYLVFVPIMDSAIRNSVIAWSRESVLFTVPLWRILHLTSSVPHNGFLY